MSSKGSYFEKTYTRHAFFISHYGFAAGPKIFGGKNLFGQTPKGILAEGYLYSVSNEALSASACQTTNKAARLFAANTSATQIRYTPHSRRFGRVPNVSVRIADNGFKSLLSLDKTSTNSLCGGHAKT